MLAFLGFAMIIVLVYFLISEKISPAPTFILIPLIAGSMALAFNLTSGPDLIKSGTDLVQKGSEAVTKATVVLDRGLESVKNGDEVKGKADIGKGGQGIAKGAGDLVKGGNNLEKASKPVDFMTEITSYIKAGLGTTMPIAVMFIFSILYFSIMGDAGMFEPLVEFLARKAGNSVPLVTLSTGLIATVAHLDGALAATLLITVPAMLPIYKRLNMRPVVLLAIIGAAMSIMNLLPWGGPTARCAAILKIDVNELWIPLIPLQVVGVAIMLAFATYLGFVEKARGAGYVAVGGGAAAAGNSEGSALKSEKENKYARPKLVWFNIFLTIGVIALLMSFSKLPAYAPFMLGTAIALVVNYSAKEQVALIKAHAANALSVPAILLASGIFLGVISGTGMLGAMASSLISVIPESLGRYLHIIMGVLAVPLGMALGTDSFFFGLVPLAIDVGTKYGIEPRTMINTMLIGKNYGVLVTPHAATTFLAVGLAGISLRELFTFCAWRLWVLSLISLAAAFILGVVPF